MLGDLGGVGRAVEDVFVGVRQFGEEVVRLGGVGLFAWSAGGVDPPDVAVGAGVGEVVQHGQDRGDADAGRDQQHRAAVVGEDELAARCGDVEQRPAAERRLQIPADQPVWLAFDADPVRVRARGRGQRVVAYRGGGVGGDAQRQVLAGESGGQRLSVRRGERDRGRSCRSR